MFKRIVAIGIALLLAVSMCGCSYIDAWLEEEEKIVITPADPHAVADYGDDVQYFWDEFQISNRDGSIILNLTGLGEFSGYDFQVDEWYADASTLRLALTGVIEETDVETDTVIRSYCSLTLHYRPDLRSAAISEGMYSSAWPDAQNFETLSDNNVRTMVRAGTALGALIKTEQGAVVATLQPYRFNETGEKVPIDLLSDSGLDAEVRTMMIALVTQKLSVTMNPTEQEKTEQIPTSICFWTKDLALIFPCTFLSSVAEGKAEWIAVDEAGKTTSYSVLRDFAEGETPPPAEGEEAQPTALEYYQANVDQADKELTEACGTEMVPYEDYFLFYDSVTHQLYRLYCK